MVPLDETPSRPAGWWVASLAAVTLLIAVDVVEDWSEGSDPLHLALELAAMVTLVAVGFAMLRRRERRIGSLTRDLSRSREEAERWRGEAEQALRGLGEAIDLQFDRWELTPAEREVGLLLLKGLSLKEVARARSTSERTARVQAGAVYRKGGLSGRSELSAFFLEDLLLPSRER
ncbi:MAG: helix-turn-helix transcriptional regulator [Sandaracinaceae bacterium]